MFMPANVPELQTTLSSGENTILFFTLINNKPLLCYLQNNIFASNGNM